MAESYPSARDSARQAADEVRQELSRAEALVSGEEQPDTKPDAVVVSKRAELARLEELAR
jgi:hypothetical protein